MTGVVRVYGRAIREASGTPTAERPAALGPTETRGPECRRGASHRPRGLPRLRRIQSHPSPRAIPPVKQRAALCQCCLSSRVLSSLCVNVSPLLHRQSCRPPRQTCRSSEVMRREYGLPRRSVGRALGSGWVVVAVPSLVSRLADPGVTSFFLGALLGSFMVVRQSSGTFKFLPKYTLEQNPILPTFQLFPSSGVWCTKETIQHPSPHSGHIAEWAKSQRPKLHFYCAFSMGCWFVGFYYCFCLFNR